MSNLIKSKRQLSVYEKQQLLRADLTESDLLSKKDLPVEYLTGQVDFANLSLKVNENVLIPRVETEELLELVIKEITYLKNDNLNVLELATGSGAISLALIEQIRDAQYFNKKWFFSLTDVSLPALELAQENYQHLLADKMDNEKISINFYQSDLLDELDKNKGYDLIVANLPYIPHDNIDQLDASVKNFEPHLALDGGPTGFELINRALKKIVEYKLLNPAGTIFLEVDLSHDQMFIKKNFPQLFNLFKITFIKDQFERNRFLVLKEH